MKSTSYLGRITRVIDGDTVEATLVANVSVLRTRVTVSVAVTCRLRGIDAYKRGTASGDAAIALLQDIVLDDIVFQTESDQVDRYGRLLVDIYNRDGLHLNTWLVEQGLALPWDGKGVRPAGGGEPAAEDVVTTIEGATKEGFFLGFWRGIRGG